MINMQFNGEDISVKQDCTVAQLLTQHKMTEGRFIVVLNESMLIQADYETTVIQTGDAIDIVSPITGG